MKARINPKQSKEPSFVDGTDYIEQIHMIQYNSNNPYIEKNMDVYYNKYNEAVDKFNYCIDERMPIRGVFAFRSPILPHIDKVPTKTEHDIRIQKWKEVQLQRDSNSHYMDKNNPEVIKQLISQGVLFFDKGCNDITSKIIEYIERLNKS